jgi:hypothetical protein
MQTLEEMITGRSSGSYLSWENIGTTYTGRVTDVQARQSRKYGTTELDTWDDGTPKMQAVITLSTDYRDSLNMEDDGTRFITINLWSGQKASLAAACKAAGVSAPEIGMTFTATHVSGAGNAKSPRVFEYTLTKANPVAESLGIEDPAQTAKGLLMLGQSIEDVAKVTGLPVQIVQALANAA